MNHNNAILLVDDDSPYREELIDELRAAGLDAAGVPSARKAVAAVKKNPRRFQFAVIDQVLGGNPEAGFDLCRELVSLNRSLFPLVFTNFPSDIPDVVGRYRRTALSAGAFRYIERTAPKAAKLHVKAFVNEMAQLQDLRDWIARYYKDRQNVPSLMTQLNIGVDIIDRSYKVWFMSDAMRRIIGLSPLDLPRSVCSEWHGFNYFPCFNCLVECSFENGSPNERLFLSPLPLREKGRLFYLRVWTQPIADAQGTIIKSPDGRPLAVMESVQDLTGSAQMHDKPLDERLGLIASALHDYCPEDVYVRKRLFDRVRILVRKADDTFILRAAAGFTPQQPLGDPLMVSHQHLEVAEQNRKQSNYGYFFEPTGPSVYRTPGIPNEGFIFWPILQDGRTFALVEVSGPGCNKDTVAALRPFVHEVQEALKDSASDHTDLRSAAESVLAPLDIELQTVSTPVDALKLLVRKGCQLTKADCAHIRYVSGEEVFLLRLADPGSVSYESVAPPIYSLSTISSCSVRTILSAQEHMLSMSENPEETTETRSKLPPEAIQFLKDFDTAYLLPLLFQSRCIGSLCFQAKSAGHFADPLRKQLAHDIACRTAVVLHDFLVEHKTAEAVEKAQNETFALILHNINTPISTVRYALSNLKEHFQSGQISAEVLTQKMNVISVQINKISGIRDKFLDLNKPHDSRKRNLQVKQYLDEQLETLRATRPGLQVVLECAGVPATVKMDKTALDLALTVLLQNSLDALETTSPPKILVRARTVSGTERQYLSCHGPGLAFDVEDNGPGVAEDLVEGLFEIIKSGKAKGAGFGLKSCRRVARSALGDVYYHPQFSPGAMFTIVLPYTPA